MVLTFLVSYLMYSLETLFGKLGKINLGFSLMTTLLIYFPKPSFNSVSILSIICFFTLNEIALFFPVTE
jgi:hypothetical protein